MQSSKRWSTRSAQASSLIVLAVVLSLSSRVFAQQNVTASATIPFAFEAEGDRFAPGDYTLDFSVPTFVIVRSKDGKHATEVPTIIFGDPVKKSEAKLVFVKRDGRYVLHSLWGIQGRYRMTPELAYKPIAGEETRAVELTYSPSAQEQVIPVSQASQ